MKNSVQRKINELKTLTNDPSNELIEALSSIDDTTFNSNTSVRTLLEEKELSELNRFIEQFSQLTTTIDRVFTTIDLLDKSCDQMLTKLSIGQKGVDEVLDMTTSLYIQQEKQRNQLTKIHSFIEEYYLSEEDFACLEKGDIDDKFFDAFSHLEASQERTSNALLTQKSRSLTDALTALNAAKERAYGRIHGWFHANSHIFNRLQPTIPSSFNKCLTIINSKPILYGFVCSEIGQVRSSVIGPAFLNALTSPTADSRPLEETASADPLAFSSNVFAWIHQTAATEATFLATVLKEDQNSPNIQKTLGDAFESVCRPLDSRVSQAIRGLVRPADCFQMANICSYFFSKISDICGITSPVAKTTKNLVDMSSEMFRQAISESTDVIKSSVRPSQSAFHEALKIMKFVTSQHEQSSLSISFDVSSLIDNYAAQLHTAVVSMKENLPFQATYLYELSNLAKDANLKCSNDIEKDKDKVVAQIIDIEVSEFLRRCRSTELINLFTSPQQKPLSTVAGGEENLVRNTVKRLENALIGTGKLQTPLCDELSNNELKKLAKEEVSKKLVNAYKILFDSVMDARNGYLNGGTIFKYTPEHIKESISV